MKPKRLVLVLTFALTAFVASAQDTRRKLIIDQDTSGPGASNLQAILLALQSPNVDLLGITVESGDAWQEEELAHVLRMLEIIGRTDIPVFRGATFPLVNTMEATKRWEQMYGKIAYKGAWMEQWADYNTVDRHPYHAPDIVPPLTEGAPHTPPAAGTAADFLIHAVHQYPGQVTIMGLGPLTNIALAARLDDSFASTAKEFVLMGGSLNPNPPAIDEFSLQFIYSPRMNFNFRWDPEAAKISLRAGWKKIVVVPTDATTGTAFTPSILKSIQAEGSPAAKYIATYPYLKLPMWDELTVAIWLDPKLVSHADQLSLDVDTNSGAAGYGETLSWPAAKGPSLGEPVVDAIRAVDVTAFNQYFIDAMARNPKPSVP